MLMGKNKSKNFSKQKLSSFTRGNVSKDMIEELDDEFNELRNEVNNR